MTSTPQQPVPETRAAADGAEQVAAMVELVRELSTQTDPQQMLLDFSERFRQTFTYQGFLSLSRRDLEAPHYRITRSSRWETKLNPWTQKDQLPLMQGGLLGELLYGDQPVLNNDFHPDPSDPAFEYLQGHRSFMAVPHYHDGVGTNMAINFGNEPGMFDPARFADHILTHNLFGRTTNNMVLSIQLREAHAAIDAELKVVGEIQRSLLPQTLPEVPHLELAAHYQTARRAGGDYYDLFRLADGRWGILIADVSGHGTPAAVVMAVTHAIAHEHAGPNADEPCAPCAMLSFINRRLAGRYDAGAVMFVTAWYGIFDPEDRSLRYAAAGHPPPRLCRGGELTRLDQAGGLPLGITPHAAYDSTETTLEPGDGLLLFTDGITEAFNPDRQQYGEARLDEQLCRTDATVAPQETLDAVLSDLRRFTGPGQPEDDQTLIAARVH
jgi:sigma-B regulation protein RsbU (phosphoserine phosphatase)